MKFHCREHSFANRPDMRVWLDDWASDSFEIMSYGDLNTLAALLEKVSTKVQFHHCDGLEKCQCPYWVVEDLQPTS